MSDYYPPATGIHTRIDQNRRISSVYRQCSALGWNEWYWETILWEKNEDGEDRIKDTFDDGRSPATVINRHKEIYDRELYGMRKEEEE